MTGCAESSLRVSRGLAAFASTRVPCENNRTNAIESGRAPPPSTNPIQRFRLRCQTGCICSRNVNRGGKVTATMRASARFALHSRRSESGTVPCRVVMLRRFAVARSFPGAEDRCLFASNAVHAVIVPALRVHSKERQFPARSVGGRSASVRRLAQIHLTLIRLPPRHRLRTKAMDHLQSRSPCARGWLRSRGLCFWHSVVRSELFLLATGIARRSK